MKVGGIVAGLDILVATPDPGSTIASIDLVVSLASAAWGTKIIVFSDCHDEFSDNSSS